MNYYEEKEIASIENEYEESIVSGNDGRRKIDVFKPKANDIYKCIGQLDVVFDYNISHGFRVNLIGTGTVIFVGNKITYVLTCAHNIRCIVIHCTKPNCNTYRLKKRNDQTTSCSVCGEMYGRNQQQKILKATNIIFRDRSIEYGNNYGKTLENYECEELYVPDNDYELFPQPKGGYDWAFVTFSDCNGVYEKRLQNIHIKLMDGRAVFTNTFNTKKDYGIFGYPNDKDNKMVGMKSNNIKQFTIKKNEKSKRYYLHQVSIDTKCGQSGSLIWCKNDNEIIVCGIHVGGSKGTKNQTPYNIGTLIGAEIMKKWNQILMESSEEIVSRMPMQLAELSINPDYDRQPVPPQTPPPDGAFVSVEARRIRYEHQAANVINGTNTETGDLKIKVHCGKGLRKQGNFATITVADNILKTTKVSSNKSPEWKETLIFKDYRPQMDNTALVSIGNSTILNEKVIGVGEFTLPIVFNKTERLEIDLADRSNKLSGIIILEQCIITKNE